MKKINNKLFISDFHLYHKNIYLYEYEARLPFFSEKLSLKELKELFSSDNKERIKKFIIDTEFNFLSWLYKEIEKENFQEYIDFWDFFFEPNNKRINEWKNTRNYTIIKNIFKLLKRKKIKTTLIIWNHDKLKYIDFYKEFFDIIIDYKYENWILYSHKPYSEWNNYWLKKDEIWVNYHWHTHSNIANEVEIYKNIEYENCCIDYYLKNQNKKELNK